jgi:HAE1 family hydrophobic/amphiphilic exporter-1
VGQLFGDIAIAIACAVALSLIVAITVIPSLSAKILGTAGMNDKRHGYANLWGGADVAAKLTGKVADLVHWITGSTVRRLAVVLVLTVAAIGFSWVLMPDREYLPTGNQNFVLGFFVPPPGYSLDEVSAVGDVMIERLAYLWETPEEEAADLPGGGVRDFWYVALNNFAFMGSSARDDLRASELEAPFLEAVTDVPGGIFVVRQSGLFEEGLGEGRAIDVELTGPDLEHLLGLGLEVFLAVGQALPDSQSRPIPALDLGNPEVRVRTHRQRAAELGLSNRELGYAVNALVDGAKASDYQHEGKEIDLVVKADEQVAHRTHLLEQLPIATPDGRLVTLGAVAEVSLVQGPVQVDHVERQRAVTIRVVPSADVPLEAAMRTIDTEVLEPLRAEEKLGGLYRANLSGTAAKLRQTWDALKWNLLLALIITYLLMAALFESFLYPFVIMFSVPLAALGGFLGLWILNLFQRQALDTLTMLAFIILIGTVVNNAILIVHQALHHMRRDGMPPRESIRDSVRVRLRPIFMSVSTSVCGMLPLVLFPGAGSELYRGLGSVVVGGLIVSTVFTLFLVPALFSLSLDARTAIVNWFRNLRHPTEARGHSA